MMIHRYTTYRDITPDWFKKFDDSVRDAGHYTMFGALILNALCTWLLYGLEGSSQYDANDNRLPFDPPYDATSAAIWTFIPVYFMIAYLIARRALVVEWYSTRDRMNLDYTYMNDLSDDSRRSLKEVREAVIHDDHRGKSDTTQARSRFDAFRTAVNTAYQIEVMEPRFDPVVDRANKFTESMVEMKRQRELNHS